MLLTYTNKHLVAHVKMAIEEKWGYVYGTIGRVLTEEILKQVMRDYPDHVLKYAGWIDDNYIPKGIRTVDCIHLIKSMFWWNNGNIKPGNVDIDGDGDLDFIDVSADGMFEKAKVKGKISTLPQLPGILLYKPGHIGVYLGQGYVGEARGTKQGVIISPLTGANANNWTDWCECPYIQYSPLSGLMYGCGGQDVEQIQSDFQQIGYTIRIDGSFGPATDKVVRDFQKEMGIIPHGIVDGETLYHISLMLGKLNTSKEWETIIDKIGASPDWKPAVKAAVAQGEKEKTIMRYLPDLIMKIYHNK